MKQETSRLTLIYFRTPASGMACARSAANWGSEGPASAQGGRRDAGDSWDAARARPVDGARRLANVLGLPPQRRPQRLLGAGCCWCCWVLLVLLGAGCRVLCRRASGVAGGKTRRRRVEWARASARASARPPWW